VGSNTGRSTRVLSLSVVGAILLAVPYILGVESYWLRIAVTIAINATMALTLRLILLTGQMNLAHPSFMAIGAYFSVFWVTRFQLPFVLGLIGSGVVAGIVALIFAYPFLRVKGVYFFLVTLCALEIFRIVISKFWREWFNGADGIFGLPAPAIGSYQFESLTPFYYLSLMILLISFIICWRIEKSWTGPVLKSISDADILARSVGVNILRWKLYVFCISCFFVGIVGGVFAFFMGGINPNNFGFGYAVVLQVFVIAGGMGSIWGPLLGALFFGGLDDIFRGLGEYSLLVNGAVLILIIVFQPEGIIGFPRRIREIVKWFNVDGHLAKSKIKENEVPNERK